MIFFIKIAYKTITNIIIFSFLINNSLFESTIKKNPICVLTPEIVCSDTQIPLESRTCFMVEIKKDLPMYGLNPSDEFLRTSQADTTITINENGMVMFDQSFQNELERVFHSKKVYAIFKSINILFQKRADLFLTSEQREGLKNKKIPIYFVKKSQYPLGSTSSNGLVWINIDWWTAFIKEVEQYNEKRKKVKEPVVLSAEIFCLLFGTMLSRKIIGYEGKRFNRELDNVESYEQVLTNEDYYLMFQDAVEKRKWEVHSVVYSILKKLVDDSSMYRNKSVLYYGYLLNELNDSVQMTGHPKNVYDYICKFFKKGILSNGDFIQSIELLEKMVGEFSDDEYIALVYKMLVFSAPLYKRYDFWEKYFIPIYRAYKGSTVYSFYQAYLLLEKCIKEEASVESIRKLVSFLVAKISLECENSCSGKDICYLVKESIDELLAQNGGYGIDVILMKVMKEYAVQFKDSRSYRILQLMKKSKFFETDHSEDLYQKVINVLKRIENQFSIFIHNQNKTQKARITIDEIKDTFYASIYRMIQSKHLCAENCDFLFNLVEDILRISLQNNSEKSMSCFVLGLELALEKRIINKNEIGGFLEFFRTAMQKVLMYNCSEAWILIGKMLEHKVVESDKVNMFIEKIAPILKHSKQIHFVGDMKTNITGVKICHALSLISENQAFSKSAISDVMISCLKEAAYLAKPVEFCEVAGMFISKSDASEKEYPDIIELLREQFTIIEKFKKDLPDEFYVIFEKMIRKDIVTIHKIREEGIIINFLVPFCLSIKKRISKQISSLDKHEVHLIMGDKEIKERQTLFFNVFLMLTDEIAHISQLSMYKELIFFISEKYPKIAQIVLTVDLPGIKDLIKSKDDIVICELLLKNGFRLNRVLIEILKNIKCWSITEPLEKKEGRSVHDIRMAQIKKWAEEVKRYKHQLESEKIDFIYDMKSDINFALLFNALGDSIDIDVEILHHIVTVCKNNKWDYVLKYIFLYFGTKKEIFKKARFSDYILRIENIFNYLYKNPIYLLSFISSVVTEKEIYFYQTLRCSLTEYSFEQFHDDIEFIKTVIPDDHNDLMILNRYLNNEPIKVPSVVQEQYERIKTILFNHPEFILFIFDDRVARDIRFISKGKNIDTSNVDKNVLFQEVESLQNIFSAVEYLRIRTQDNDETYILDTQNQMTVKEEECLKIKMLAYLINRERFVNSGKKVLFKSIKRTITQLYKRVEKDFFDLDYEIQKYSSKYIFEALYVVLTTQAINQKNYEKRNYYYTLAADVVIGYALLDEDIDELLSFRTIDTMPKDPCSLRKIIYCLIDDVYINEVSHLMIQGKLGKVVKDVEAILLKRRKIVRDQQRRLIESDEEDKEYHFVTGRSPIGIVRGFTHAKGGHGDCSSSMDNDEGNPVLHTIDPNTEYGLAKDGSAYYGTYLMDVYGVKVLGVDTVQHVNDNVVSTIIEEIETRAFEKGCIAIALPYPLAGSFNRSDIKDRIAKMKRYSEGILIKGMPWYKREAELLDNYAGVDVWHSMNIGGGYFRLVLPDIEWYKNASAKEQAGLKLLLYESLLRIPEESPEEKRIVEYLARLKESVPEQEEEFKVKKLSLNDFNDGIYRVVPSFFSCVNKTGVVPWLLIRDKVMDIEKKAFSYRSILIQDEHDLSYIFEMSDSLSFVYIKNRKVIGYILGRDLKYYVESIDDDEQMFVEYDSPEMREAFNNYEQQHKKAVYIESFAVLPEQQSAKLEGNSIGSLLRKQFKYEARQQGYHYITGHTDAIVGVAKKRIQRGDPVNILATIVDYGSTKTDYDFYEERLTPDITHTTLMEKEVKTKL